MISRLLLWLEARLGLGARFAILTARIDALEAEVRLLKAPKGTLVPVPIAPRYSPDDLPPGIAKLVDWHRLGIEPPEEKELP
jgi:hypothetical protein